MILTPDSFYYKKDLDSLAGTIEISKTVVYCPKPTLFGPSVPSFKKFLNFLNLKPYVQGFANYNRLGFTTQVPSRVTYLVPYDLEITYDYFNKVYPLSIVTAEFLSNFTVIEYMVFDCLTMFPNLGDGYYSSPESLAKGMIKTFYRIKKDHTQELDWPKIYRLALLVNPKIDPYFKRHSILG